MTTKEELFKKYFSPLKEGQNATFTVEVANKNATVKKTISGEIMNITESFLVLRVGKYPTTILLNDFATGSAKLQNIGAEVVLIG